MLNLAASLLTRLAEILAAHGPEPIAIPIRRDDRRDPRRGDRRL